MKKRLEFWPICTIVAGTIGAGFFGWWLATLAWISATPISEERLALVQRLSVAVLTATAACLGIILIGVVRLIRGQRTRDITPDAP